jgi:LPS-assembly protein
MFRVRRSLPFFLSLLLLPVAAFAQDMQDLSSCKVYQTRFSQAERLEDVSRFYGSPDSDVRIDCDELQFSADYVEVFRKKDLLSARGHVVFVSGGNRIAADRAEFNTRTRTGTFYNAAGILSLGERADRSMFGTQEPDAYFRGDELHKVGPKKYRIVNGAFSTCVQPTPRWEISSGSFTINLDEYALLRNAVLRVKGVPLMYLPVFYYPVQEDDRATGFLMPTYGASTIKGQTISNAFFWAIGRSQDATFMHDWLTKAGNQFGGEYRYVAAPGSQGNARFSLLDEKNTTITLPGGATREQPARRSYSIGGDVSQRLPGTFRLRANADYFSSIVTQQQYQQDLYRATNRNRRFGTHVTGTLGQYQVSATADRTDYFYTETSLSTYGALPRVTLSRPEKPVGSTPFYFGVTGEYVTLLRSTTQNDVKTQDQGLTRLDINPVLRIPFNRLTFLGVNTAVSWRGTYWTESLTPPVRGQSQQQIPEGIGRQYVDVLARITGPVFTRVFNPPEGSTRQRFKHVIEPSLVINRVSAIDVFDRIVRLESVDTIVGNSTRYRYALTNRLYGKKNVPRELATVTISQTYYTQATASQYDPQYQSSFTAREASNFSPVALQARTSPVERLQAEFRTEWDHRVNALLTMAASGTYSHGHWLDASAGWSQRRFIQNLPGFNDPNRADQYLNAAVNLRGFRNRIGGSYTFNYDLQRQRFLHQRYVAYYNAQCCGIGFEYQTFNLQGSFVNYGVPQDRRFNISFTLAGIGTFSNLFGAFGGEQGR